MGLTDYRDRLYKKYAIEFQNAKPIFDEMAADRWGRAYDHYRRGWLPDRRDAVIVDVGCGAGKLLHFFKKRGYVNLSGVDINPEQVRLAGQVIENVTEANAIEFLKGHKFEFDLITGLDIIEHFNKDEVLHFLDACHKALKRGGRLILQTPNAESPWVSSVRYGDFSHEVCFNSNGITRIFNSVWF